MGIVNNRQRPNAARRPAALGPAARATLTGQIAARLGEAIRSGTIPAGARLIEQRIAEEMQTSRGPIREALRQLAESGLVEIQPHRGAVVTLPSEDDLADMVVMRAILESAAARLIVNRRDQLDFTSLTEIVDRMHVAAKNRRPERLRGLDWEFHSEICRLSGSPYLRKCWGMMRDGLGLIMSSGRKVYRDLDAVAASHAEIVEVLRTAAPSDAERYLRRRLLESGFRWLGRAAPDL